MSDLAAARVQMGMSLAFHIVFTAIGIGLPLLFLIAEGIALRTGNETYRQMARRWGRVAAALFAVGAVSGTVLSFELGLLWPEFMRFAGPIVGMPFSLEGFAFFTEAIFLGIYLYGWDRISSRAHLLAGVLVALSGMLSGIFVVTANAWMNAPAGFTLVDGKPTEIDPIAGMLNGAALEQTLHMTLAAYAATGFAVAGIHAWFLLRDPTSGFHRRALVIAMLVAVPASILQPLSGDLSARYLARHQPVKLAAAEALFETRTHAPLTMGGWPDTEAGRTRFGIEIPSGLSLLAYHDPGAEVKGLDIVPRADWPNVPLVHFAFQIMVGLGTYLAAVSLWAAWLALRRRDPVRERWLLRAVVVGGPGGLLAVEAGWMLTELGRQPWTIYGVLRTADAVTPMPGLIVPFIGITLLYCFLGVVVAWLLWSQVVTSSPEGEHA